MSHDNIANVVVVNLIPQEMTAIKWCSYHLPYKEFHENCSQLERPGSKA